MIYRHAPCGFDLYRRPFKLQVCKCDGSHGDGEVDAHTIPATIMLFCRKRFAGRQTASGKPWTPSTQPERSLVIDVDVSSCKQPDAQVRNAGDYVLHSDA